MNYIIIVAGGKGLRMGGGIPKQFLPIAGKPILMHTIERFRKFDSALRIILVLPQEDQEYWKQLCKEHRFEAPYILADGGQTRFHSVRNGLAMIPDNTVGVVGVHDGVRPFVSIDTIRRCFEAAKHHAAAIPVIPVVETLRSLGGKTVSRDDYKLVQTPQTFSIPLLKRAYRQDYQKTFTDDASVVEKLGEMIVLVESNRENIKITTPFDLLVAEALCQKGM